MDSVASNTTDDHHLAMCTPLQRIAEEHLRRHVCRGCQCSCSMKTGCNLVDAGEHTTASGAAAYLHVCRCC